MINKVPAYCKCRFPCPTILASENCFSWKEVGTVIVKVMQRCIGLKFHMDSQVCKLEWKESYMPSKN